MDFPSHAEARCEWPIAGRIKDTLISGTVDRLFRDEGGRLWIIDFKIAGHEGGELEIFLMKSKGAIARSLKRMPYSRRGSFAGQSGWGCISRCSMAGASGASRKKLQCPLITLVCSAHSTDRPRESRRLCFEVKPKNS